MRERTMLKHVSQASRWEGIQTKSSYKKKETGKNAECQKEFFCHHVKAYSITSDVAFILTPPFPQPVVRIDFLGDAESIQNERSHSKESKCHQR